jgi:2-polyprenyl-3-methyl-5-hydroxy-6-metoxy-1,4-benzoquinol methylase
MELANSLFPNCMICGSKSKFLVLKDGFKHNICMNDNCLFIFVVPVPSNLDKVYSSYPNVCMDDLPIRQFYAGIKINKNISFSINLINSFKIESVLDIGSRNGNFLLAMKKIGRVNSAIGIEPNTSAWQYCKGLGLDVRHGFFSKEIVSNQKFDLINIADVIEHVTNPRLFIREATQLLNQNGLILIRTPNLSSYWSKITYKLSIVLRLPWSSLTPPEHIYNFSKNNLTNFLESESLEIQSIYFEPPNLLYELGQLHLIKQYRKERSLRRAFKFLVGFSAYTLVFVFLKLLQPILKENFSQTILVKRVSDSQH